MGKISRKERRNAQKLLAAPDREEKDFISKADRRGRRGKGSVLLRSKESNAWGDPEEKGKGQKIRRFAEGKTAYSMQQGRH